MDIQNLLELRKRIKARKPKFIRQDFHKKIGLKRKWRKPKGLQSKMRLKIKGKGRPVSRGYGSPKKVRGLHKSGLESKMIASEKDLQDLDSKKHGLIISSALGNKKRISILKKSDELGLKILNIKDPSEFIKSIEEKISVKKGTEKEKISKEKKEKKEEKLPDKLSDKEKEEIKKKEKDKILTKRER